MLSVTQLHSPNYGSRWFHAKSRDGSVLKVERALEEHDDEEERKKGATSRWISAGERRSDREFRVAHQQYSCASWVLTLRFCTRPARQYVWSEDKLLVGVYVAGLLINDHEIYFDYSVPDAQRECEDRPFVLISPSSPQESQMQRARDPSLESGDVVITYVS